MTDNTVKNICHGAGKCSGCQLNNLPYSHQLNLKQKRVNALFHGIIKPEKIIESPDIFRYRNKASAVFFEDKNKEIRWGIYKSSSGGFCAAHECFLQPENADVIFNSLAKLLKSFKVKLYNPENRTGFFRSAMVRTAYDGSIMVALITAEGNFPKENSFINALVNKCGKIKTVVQSIYTGDAVIMTGENEKILYGSGYLEDKILSKTFRISAHSFYQINSKQTENLYQKAIELAQLKNDESFLDAYCGTGTIGIAAAENAGRGTGVEINKTAVEDAIKNAEINGVKNMNFICGDAGDILNTTDEKYDVVFTDPPRAGCSKKFLSALVKNRPERIVYISCCPETQVRDIKFLLKNGYRVRHAAPFDMFPHTTHVETVVLLSNKNSKPKSYVEIGVDADDYYRIKEGK